MPYDQRTIADSGAANRYSAVLRLQHEAARLATSMSCPRHGLPPLSPETRLPPAPPWYSPNCATGLMHERESWRKLMTESE